LQKLVAETSADEVIVVTDTYEHEARLESYQRVARIASTIIDTDVAAAGR
jgi:hypothetical protein